MFVALLLLESLKKRSMGFTSHLQRGASRELFLILLIRALHSPLRN